MDGSASDPLQPESVPRGQATTPETQERIVEALVAMQAAIRTIRLYPPTSVLIANALHRAFELLNAILVTTGPIELSESERAMLINGQPLGEKSGKKPQVVAFLEWMRAVGVRSLTLQAGLTAEELRSLLELSSCTADEFEAGEGFRESFARSAFVHVAIDQKIYVAIDKVQWAMNEAGLSEAQIARLLTGEAGMDHEDREKLAALAGSPRELARALQASVDFIGQKQSLRSPDELAADLARLVDNVEPLVGPEDIPEVARQLESHIRSLHGAIGQQLAQRLSAGTLGRSVARRLAAPHGSASAAPLVQAAAVSDTRQATDAESAIATETQLQDTPRGQGRQLPEVIAGLYRSKRGQVAEHVLSHLARGLESPGAPARAAAADALGAVGEMLLAEQQHDALERLVPLLTHWVAREGRPGAAYARVGRLLERTGRDLLRHKRYDAADPILETYHHLAAQAQSRPEVAQQATEVLHGIAQEQVLEDLLAGSGADPDSSVSGPARILSRLLVVVGDLLLDRLRDSMQRSERVRLIRVLSELGTLSPQLLVDRLKAGGPWYFVRNLVMLLARVGKGQHVSVLAPLLTHADIRVRLEALNAIHQLGGPQREKVLIGALSQVDDRLRLSIVTMLGALRSRPAVAPLLRLLESTAASGDKAEMELNEKICAALGRIGSDQALPVLQRLAAKRGLGILRTPGVRLRAAAAAAIEAIRFHSSDGSVAQDLEPAGEQGGEANAGHETPPVDSLLQAEEAKASVVRIVERMRAYVSAGEIGEAVRLRGQLTSIRPMPLAELALADEALGASACPRLERTDLQEFGALCETLSESEAKALLDALQAIELAADEVAVGQGEPTTPLLLVLSGELQVTCRAADRDELIQVLGPGEIAGWEQCTKISVATVGISAITQAKVAALASEILADWRQQRPDLSRKVLSYCDRFERISKALLDKGLDRRFDRRFPALNDVQVQLLGADGQPGSKAFPAQMQDISVGGLSMHLRVSNPRSVHLLLGRWLLLHFSLPSLGALAQKGRVVALRPVVNDNVCLHVMFEHPLPLADTSQN